MAFSLFPASALYRTHGEVDEMHWEVGASVSQQKTQIGNKQIIRV